jgi:DNA-binding MarR family transcriptional regulator
MKPASIREFKERLLPRWKLLPYEFHSGNAWEYLDVSPGTATRLIREMHEMGWLRRIGCGKYRKILKEVEE